MHPATVGEADKAHSRVERRVPSTGGLSDLTRRWCELAATERKKNTCQMIKCRADLLTTREARGKSEERKIGRDDVIEKDVLEKLGYIYDIHLFLSLYY